MEKFCKSCGMPMDIPEDFANKDMNGDYCYYCGDKESNKERLTYLKKEEYHNKIKKKVKKKK